MFIIVVCFCAKYEEALKEVKEKVYVLGFFSLYCFNKQKQFALKQHYIQEIITRYKTA